MFSVGGNHFTKTLKGEVLIILAGGCMAQSDVRPRRL